MKKNEIYFKSGDGRTDIHAIEWIPEEEPKAVLQICHGMVEYIDRYDEFARFLVQKGYYVVGHDHLGHGASVRGEEEYGFFHETKGNEVLQRDIHTLRVCTKKKYPTVPYILMGHSMGSFLVRQYIQTKGEGLAGVILMGSGHQPAIVLRAGMALCRVFSKVKGDHYRSVWVDRLAFGGFNRKFAPARTKMDWLSKDNSRVDAYLAHPWCNFTFTVNAYYHMFSGMLELTKTKRNDLIPKDLPIFLVSGKDDPVGGFGKGVIKVYKEYKSIGLKQVRMHLYEKDRHELLNETDRGRVMWDIYEWLKLQMLHS